MGETKDQNIVSRVPGLSQGRGTIVSISGKSGLGKTTFALQIVGSFLKEGDQCVWIQASEQFPKKRLATLFKGSPDKVNSLLKNIFVYPVNGPFLKFRNQSDFFRKLSDIALPFDTKFIVIDNVSHHLRFASSLYSDLKKRDALLNEFFSTQLFPLVMRCLRENFALLLIHEVSYDPSSGSTKPFFDKLYSRINSVNVSMSKAFDTGLKHVEISSRGHDIEIKVPYEIKDRGILLL
jgi:hypothetical protein